MTEFQSPEVRVTEKRSAPVTYPSFSPGVAAFIGITEKGPVNTPVRVYSPDDAEEVFGGFIVGSYLMDEVVAFFNNGGESCFINRISHYDAGVDTGVAASAMLQSGGVDALLVEASSPGTFGNLYRISSTRNDTAVAKVAAVVAGARSSLTVSSITRLAIGDTVSVTKGADTQRGTIVSIDPVTKIIQLDAPITVPVGGYAGTEDLVLETLTLQVIDKSGIGLYTYRNLRMSSLSPKDFIETKVNEVGRTPVNVWVQPGVTGDKRPTDTVNTFLGTETAGSNGGTVVDADYIGSASNNSGLYAFDNNEDFLMLAIPGITTASVVKAVETYTEARQDIIGFTDIPQGLTPDAAVTFIRNTSNIASSYLVTYYPWLRALDYRNSGISSFPPSGYAMGVFARTFRRRNIGKAPAGTEDGKILGVTGVDFEVQKSAYDKLYPARINAIQKKRGYGICIMGSRTLDSVGDFIQINKRVVFVVVKRYFKESTQWVQFENNDETTRARVRRGLGAYLRGLRQSQILAGASDGEAFFIVCDETNNGASVRRAGKLRCRVGLNTGDTIEFVEMTLEQDTRALDAELAAEQG